MEAFARLHRTLEAERDDARIAAIGAYVRDAPPDDAALAVSLLKGQRPRRILPAAVMRDAAMRAAGIARWLFDACKTQVGDVAETVALVVPSASRTTLHGLAWWSERIASLATVDAGAAATRLVEDWDSLSTDARIVYAKLVSGTYRSPVSPALVDRALAPNFSVPVDPRPPFADASLRVDAVLVYAEPAAPKGFALGAFTFALWDERGGARTLTPIARIDDVAEHERSALEAIERRTTVERFGPVRRVTPTLVCELAFEAVEASGRRKSGWRLRAPRVVRVRDDASVDDAATLADLGKYAR
jgi:hypothetical protein